MRSIDEAARQWAERGIGREPEPAQDTVEPPRDDPSDVWARTAPARFSGATLDDLDRQTRDTVAEWLERPGRNLLLLGNVGVGKTHAALAATRAAIDRGWTVAFWPVVELLDQLRPSGDSDGDEAYQRAVKRGVLVLDDLGAEKPSSWTAERLYALVNRRWLEQRPIIATSNLAVSGGQGPLVEAVGRRVYDRLAQDAVMLQMGGGSRRRGDS